MSGSVNKFMRFALVENIVGIQIFFLKPKMFGLENGNLVYYVISSNKPFTYLLN